MSIPRYMEDYTVDAARSPLRRTFVEQDAVRQLRVAVKFYARNSSH